MTGFNSKRKMAQDRLDDDDIQIYAKPSRKRPIEADYTSQVAYTRALELFCDTLAQPDYRPVKTYHEGSPVYVSLPVAWAVYYKGGGSKSLHWPEQHSPNGDANMFDAVPLVPQRPWVGLTDEEWMAMYDKFAKHQEYGAFISGWDKFARAIDAVLMEKNFD